MVRLIPALPPVTPTVALVCSANSWLALLLSFLPSTLNATSYLSFFDGEPLTVVLKENDLPGIGAPEASSIGTLMVRSLLWPGTMVPVPMLCPFELNTS
ncbi:hypothetical protein D3C87_1414370 [compost metagenome]